MTVVWSSNPFLRCYGRLYRAFVSKRCRGRQRNGSRGKSMADKEKILGRMDPSCPSSLFAPTLTVPSAAFRLVNSPRRALRMEWTGYCIWEGGRHVREKTACKSLGRRGCLRGASGSQDAWESCLRLQPAVSEEDSPSLDSGFPCLLGDAQYMRRCTSGQSEDFIYIIWEK